eukprot:1768655-Amphidinium_carterae.1
MAMAQESKFEKVLQLLESLGCSCCAHCIAEHTVVKCSFLGRLGGSVELLIATPGRTEDWNENLGGSLSSRKRHSTKPESFLTARNSLSGRAETGYLARFSELVASEPAGLPVYCHLVILTGIP